MPKSTEAMPFPRLARTCELSATPAPARRELRTLLEGADWPGDVDAVVLAVHEAIMNSAHHAGGATSATAELDGATLVVEVRDRGPGFDLDRHARRSPSPLAERGRGLWLISRIASSYEVQRRGNHTCLRLAFRP